MMLDGPSGFSGEEAAGLGRRDGVEGADETVLAFFLGGMVVRQRGKGDIGLQDVSFTKCGKILL